ncbi:S-acyl fatty acid synthase thioesterase, medium chain [Trichechus manatus latirostris]|uniref:S-acyl fatty acid synthase thioesterase, medium chain n=1 Tax=Trichechus manatus latirostris TaxID=127582 RepID=A0A2Y9DT25_TRIMA|nr:S-acyl fatty acid synthase thioesterase, medium chain [Trichechus manatus latirostris]
MEERDKAGKARNGKVVNCLYQNPNAIFRLICFPWAGSGSIHFAKWGQKIHASLEVHSIRLAGRESRFEEPFASDIYDVADEIACALLPLLKDKPFAFFGHSMGSYIAFTTALHLKEKHKLEPMHFFVSSTPAPHSKFRPRIPEGKEITEEAVSHFLLSTETTIKNFIDNEELFQQHVPILLADFRMISNFIFDTPFEAVLSCDLSCFIGSEDTAVKDLEAWKDVTTGSFYMHRLPGDHFYLTEPSNETFIMNYITKCLELSTLSCY